MEEEREVKRKNKKGGIFLPSVLKAESGPRLAEREAGGGVRVLCQTSDNPPKALRCVCVCIKERA